VSYTVDTNVLLYASDSASAVHRQAAALLRRVSEGPELVYLFWPVVAGYLRMATHPAIFAAPLTIDTAMANIAALIERPHVRTPGETEAFWRVLGEVVGDAQPAGNLVPDAHLVALMREHGVRTIWSRNRDLRRFSGIEVRDPFAE